MRVLQILPELNVGGVETGTVDFAAYLVNHGHKSVVISNGGSMVERLEAEGSRHYQLPVHRKSFFTVRKMIRAVREIIRQEKIQIVHARSRIPAWIAYFACRSTRASFITTCHGFYSKPIYSQVMGWPKLIIVPSEVIARHMIETYKVSADRIRCIPRSVDLERFKAPRRPERKDGSCTIAIVGRITALKGHTYFLQAMAKVVRHIPYAKIWIIGDAPKKKLAYREELETLVKRLGLSQNVEFLGNQQDVPGCLKKVDVLCFSSTEPESFGRAIVEAQAMRVPVVATSVGGVVDIIEDGRTGFLVLPKDPDAMADRVLKLVNDKALVKKMTSAALKKVREKYTVEQMSESTLAVYKELRRSFNILVIKISSIGDVVLVTASLKALRAKFPKSPISVFVGRESRRILAQCPYVDEIIPFDHKGKQKGYLELWRMGKKLRRMHFDKVVDFQNNRKSHLLSFLTMAPEAYGFDNKKWSRLLTNPLKDYRNDIPAVEHQFQILKRLGIEYDDDVRLELWPTKTDDEHVQKLLDQEWLGNAKQIVGINVSASEKWPSKNWPVEHIVELCDRLGAENIRVVLTGMKKDREVAKAVNTKAKSRPANLAGQTDMMQLAALVRRCNVFVTPDSAPLHVSAAVETPVVALFGPTDSARHVPPADQIKVLETRPECAPCYSGQCRVKTHVCMKEITVDDVYREIKKLMA